MKQDVALKSLAAAKDTVGVYINRNELLGATIKINEALDGALIGQTAANTDLNREVKA